MGHAWFISIGFELLKFLLKHFLTSSYFSYSKCRERERRSRKNKKLSSNSFLVATLKTPSSFFATRKTESLLFFSPPPFYQTTTTYNKIESCRKSRKKKEKLEYVEYSGTRRKISSPLKPLLEFTMQISGYVYISLYNFFFS